MSAYFLGFIGMWETVAILAVVLILFGARKLPELAKGLGSGIKEFRKATREVNQDLQRAFEAEDEPVSPEPPRKKVAPKPKPTVEASTESKS
jgi:sec-independent protein translocase protein TatA